MDSRCLGPHWERNRPVSASDLFFFLVYSRPEIRPAAFAADAGESTMQFFGGSSLTSVAPEASPAPAPPPGTGTVANAQVLYAFNRNGVRSGLPELLKQSQQKLQ